MFTVKIICNKCGSELPVVNEFKDGAKKDWFVNPCETCKSRDCEQRNEADSGQPCPWCRGSGVVMNEDWKWVKCFECVGDGQV